MRPFPMSMSRAVQFISLLSTLLVLAVPLLVWSAIPGLRLTPSAEVARWSVLLVPLIPLASWALAPRSLELEGGELRILRRAWRAASYPLARIDEVALLPRGWMLGAWKTFGNGGLFGYYGWFYRKGSVRLFCTRGDRLVEVMMDGRRIVVSPDEPGRFMEELRAVAPRARVRAGP